MDVTLLVRSKSFLTYLIMMELFPAFWSPTITILNFWMAVRLLAKLIWSSFFIPKYIYYQTGQTCHIPLLRMASLY